MRYGILLLALVVATSGCTGRLHNKMATDLVGACATPTHGPGVAGPGPGVMMYEQGMAVQSVASQVAFVGPDGMLVSWDVSMPGQFDSEGLVCPGRYNFQQGAIYRLKLTNVPGRPGVELYPTLEVGPAMPRTQAFLSHNAMPVQITEEDFDQVLSGNFVTKVIYLPDPEYQELALAGVETLVSTRLDPGVDPIVEADRRGSIMGILRIGNKDFEIPGDGMPGGDVMPASFTTGAAGGVPTPMPLQGAMGNGGWVPSNYISGVSGPQYGVPMTGTMCGLPGPPLIPLGVQAGKRQHQAVTQVAPQYANPADHTRVGGKLLPGHQCAPGGCQTCR